MLESKWGRISMLRGNNFTHLVNVIVVFLASTDIHFWQSATAIACSMAATIATIYFQFKKFKLDTGRQGERRHGRYDN